MGHVALRPWFLFIKSLWVKLLSLLLFVVSNQIALDTHCDVVSSLIKILNFQTSVCYVPSFKLISKWVNPNSTSLVDLNKILIRVCLRSSNYKKKKNDDEKRKKKMVNSVGITQCKKWR